MKLVVEEPESLALERQMEGVPVVATSAIRIKADVIVAYDRRLLEAAAERGLTVLSPGA